MQAIFYPRKDFNVEVCAHRLGKKMTYTEQTDTQQVGNSYTPFMTLAKARNIKVGCFLLLTVPISDAEMKSDYDGGYIWFDAYSYTSELASKISGGQTITQEEWNAAYQNTLFPNFFGFLGKKPVALSYAYGNQTFADYITQLLGGRNSGISGNTSYGVGYGTPADVAYSFATYKSRPSTMRWYDTAKSNGNDFSGQLAIVSSKIDETLLNGGWLNNFTHWHNYYSDGNEAWAATYLDLLASKNANNEIYFAGYGEALAYMVFRQMITDARMYVPKAEPTKLAIALAAPNTMNIDTDLLQVPISIKFSTTGTPLAGKQIESDCNIISLGNNEYIIEIPYVSEYSRVFINEKL